jgi:hypothetical protein
MGGIPVAVVQHVYPMLREGAVFVAISGLCD